MKIFKKRVEINATIFGALILVLLGWLGVFRQIELWLADGEWVTVNVESSECVEGTSLETYRVSSCDQYYFYSLETNDIVRASCVGSCKDQLGLLNPGTRYRIVTTDFPIMGKRILKIEKYD